MARTLIARLGDAAERAVEAARATVLPIHPLQIDVLKLIACVCMLIDHINTCLYDRASVWAWLIGRLAFPLFGLTFVLTLKAHKAMATAKRLFIWAICTQPVYALAFAHTGFSPWWAGNILFSFATVAYLVALAQTPSPANIAKGLAVFVLASVIQAPSSFGAAGLIFLFALHYVILTPHRSNVASGLIFLSVFFLLNLLPTTICGLLPTSYSWLIYSSTFLRKFSHLHAHRRGWSMHFYFGHLLVFASAILYSPRVLLVTPPGVR